MKDQGQKWIFGAVGLLVGVLLTVGYYNLGAVNGESVQGKLGPLNPAIGRLNQIPDGKGVDPNVCWYMYEYKVTHSAGDFSKWAQNTGWQTHPTFQPWEIQYCSDYVVGKAKWAAETPTNSQCVMMYQVYWTPGQNLSTWMPTQGYEWKDAQYCSSNVIGDQRWASGHPSDSECTSLYNYLKLAGETNFNQKAYSGNPPYTSGDVDYCRTKIGAAKWDDAKKPAVLKPVK